MNAFVGPLIILCLVTSIFNSLEASEDADTTDIGEFQPLTPSKREEEMCKDNAKGKIFKTCSKKIHHTCYIQCHYEEGDEELKSPNKILCCDMGGAAPTGRCKDGVCDPKELMTTKMF